MVIFNLVKFGFLNSITSSQTPICINITDIHFDKLKFIKQTDSCGFSLATSAVYKASKTISWYSLYTGYSMAKCDNLNSCYNKSWWCWIYATATNFYDMLLVRIEFISIWISPLWIWIITLCHEWPCRTNQAN